MKLTIPIIFCLFIIFSYFIISAIHTNNIQKQRTIDLKKAYSLIKNHKKEAKKISKKHGVDILIYDEFGNIKIKRNKKRN
jgi:predicted Fe-Mo cluster-binding NifX family protein